MSFPEDKSESEEDKSMKKAVTFITMMIMLFSVLITGRAEMNQTPEMPVIGIAWRADTDSEFFTNVCKAV